MGFFPNQKEDFTGIEIKVSWAKQLFCTVYDSYTNVCDSNVFTFVLQAFATASVFALIGVPLQTSAYPTGPFRCKQFNSLVF